MGELRLSRPGDEKTLKALWKDVFGDGEAFIELFFREVYTPGMAAVAAEDGKIVSAAYAVPFGEALYIYAVGTRAEYRGRGLGKAVTLLAAGGRAAYLCPAEPSLFGWYQREMGAEPVSRRAPAAPPEKLAEISPEEYRARREAMLSGVPHAAYSDGILKLFSLSGGFFAGEDGSLWAMEDGRVHEALPPSPGGEPYILGINGAGPIYWGLTLA